MSNTQKYALTGAAILQRVGAEQPIANAMLDARRLDVTGPIADIEMETSVEQRTCRWGDELHVHVLRGACAEKERERENNIIDEQWKKVSAQ